MKKHLNEDERHPSGLADRCRELTREKQQMERLKRQWEATLDAVDDPVFVHDEKFRIIRSNTAYARLADMPVKEIIGRPYWKVFPRRRAPLPGCKKAFTELREGAEEDIVLQSGERFHSRSFCSRDNHSHYCVHILEDITDKYRIQEELRAKHERMQQYLDVAGVMFVLLDRKGTVQMINCKGCEILGYQEKDILGKNWFDCFLPARVKRRVAEVHRQQMQGQSLPFERFDNPVLRKDGEERIVSWHNAAICGSNGKVQFTLSSGEDVTDRARAEEALRRTVHNLGERQKELRCLYTVLTLSNKNNLTVEQCLQGMADAMPPALQFPDITCARITLPNGQFAAGDFRDTPWRLTSPIKVKGKPLGSVEVVYLEEKSVSDNDPFLREEVSLLNSIADIVGDYWKRKQSENALELHGRIAGIFATVADDEMFNEVLKVVLNVLDSPFGVFGYLNETALVVPTMTRQVWDKCNVPDRDIVFPRETWGNNSWVRALRQKKPVCSNEPSSMLPEGHIAISRHISMPILFRGEAIGLFQIANKPTDYTESDIATLSNIARHAAPLLDARLKREQAEVKLEKTNRALTTLSAGNMILVRAESEQELLQQVCEVIVKEGGFRMAWIGHAEHDEEKTVRPMAHAGAEGGYLGSVHVSWADNEWGRGPTGRAIRTGRPSIVQNIAQDPDFGPWCKQALAHGYASAIALPLQSNKQTFGVLIIYSATAADFDEEEIRLLKEMAGDLAYGIMALRTRAERDRNEQALRESQASLREAMIGSITVASRTVEMRDPYTAGHQQRVAQLSVAIAREFGWPEERIEGLRLGAMIHDIGKINVPADILTNPGELSPIEFALVQSHAVTGYEILKDVRFPWPVADIAHQHHERLDGSGYPQGLKGDQICEEAKIVAVADVVEAMSSHRPYRPTLGMEATLAEIESGRGTLYDEKAVDACMHLIREKGFTLHG